MRDFFVYLGLLSTAVLGIACVFWPKAVQKFSIKMSEWTAPNDIFRDSMRSDIYLLEIKVIGVLSILAVIFVVYVISTQ